MLKKLQDLLFEDDEEEIEEEVEIEEPAQPEPAVLAAKEEPKPEEKIEIPEPVKEPEPVVSKPVLKAEETEVRPAMQRIDVTQQIPAQNINTSRREPARTESVFREPAKPAPAFDIKVDEKPAPQPKRTQSKPAAKPAARQPQKKQSSGYQFQPVISPIFGVDEKDMNALKTTTTKISEAAKVKADPNISPIISPMYGMNQEDKPSSIQKTVRKSNEQEAIMTSPAYKKAEEDIPEFSLDDILKSRDEEFAEAKSASQEETAPLFPDLNLWDEEPESADDATIVIEKPVK